MNKLDIPYLKEFMNLISLNFISFFKIPLIGKIKLKRWTSHSLIEKCQVGSYLFSKQFLIMYEDAPRTENEKLSDYKIEINLNYDLMKEKDLSIKPFFVHKDKFIFSPFSQFVMEKIQATHGYKIITLKYEGNS